MRREYEIFERFPDGSSMWRAFVCGQYDAQRKMLELSEHSENAFYAIDLKAHKLLPSDLLVTDARRQTKHQKGNKVA